MHVYKKCKKTVRGESVRINADSRYSAQDAYCTDETRSPRSITARFPTSLPVLYTLQTSRLTPNRSFALPPLFFLLFLSRVRLRVLRRVPVHQRLICALLRWQQQLHSRVLHDGERERDMDLEIKRERERVGSLQPEPVSKQKQGVYHTWVELEF